MRLFALASFVCIVVGCSGSGGVTKPDTPAPMPETSQLKSPGGAPGTMQSTGDDQGLSGRAR